MVGGETQYHLLQEDDAPARPTKRTQAESNTNSPTGSPPRKRVRASSPGSTGEQTARSLSFGQAYQESQVEQADSLEVKDSYEESSRLSPVGVSRIFVEVAVPENLERGAYAVVESTQAITDVESSSSLPLSGSDSLLLSQSQSPAQPKTPQRPRSAAPPCSYIVPDSQDIAALASYHPPETETPTTYTEIISDRGQRATESEPADFKSTQVTSGSTGTDRGITAPLPSSYPDSTWQAPEPFASRSDTQQSSSHLLSPPREVEANSDDQILSQQIRQSSFLSSSLPLQTQILLQDFEEEIDHISEVHSEPAHLKYVKLYS